MIPSSSAAPALVEFAVRITLPVLWGDMDALGHVNNTIPIIRSLSAGSIAAASRFWNKPDYPT
jgi:hypothetical protein